MIASAVAGHAKAVTLTPFRTILPSYGLTRSSKDQSPSQGQSEKRQSSADSVWRKVCLKGGPTDTRFVCLVGMAEHFRHGTVMVALMEPTKTPERILRVTLPLGMRLEEGASVTVDRKWPRVAPFVICRRSGCIADFRVGTNFIKEMESGHNVKIQAVNVQGLRIKFVLPLSGFRQAYLTGVNASTLHGR